MPTPEEIRLAAALAGSLNKELDGAVGHKKIESAALIKSFGPEPLQAGIISWSDRHKTQAPIKIPGFLEEPRSTPTGSDVIGLSNEMPELIPIPADLEKYAKEYLKDIHQPTDPEIPQDPEIQLITEPNPVPEVQIPQHNLENSLEVQILKELAKISKFLGITEEEVSITLPVLLQENAKISKRKTSKKHQQCEEDQLSPNS